jgi:alkaline phosphatase D
MTGAEQERWLLRALSSSSTRWNVIAQQVMMAQLNQGTGSDEAYDLEAWDGYVAQRKRILDCFQECCTPNPVVISGDMHTSWVSDLKADFDDPSSPTVGTEFVGSSTSSNCATSTIETYKNALGEKNPHIRYFDTRKGGYVRCELTPKQWRSDLQVADSVEDRYSPVRTIASFAIEAGYPGIQGGC